MTSRVSHQLVTRIFAIFLREMLDFDNIKINDGLDALPKLYSDDKVLELATLIELKRSAHPAINVRNNNDFLLLSVLKFTLPL